MTQYVKVLPQIVVRNILEHCCLAHDKGIFDEVAKYSELPRKEFENFLIELATNYPETTDGLCLDWLIPSGIVLPAKNKPIELEEIVEGLYVANIKENQDLGYFSESTLYKENNG